MPHLLVLVATLSTTFGAETGYCEGLPPQPRLKIWPVPKNIQLGDEAPLFKFRFVPKQSKLCKDAEYMSLLRKTFIAGDDETSFINIVCDARLPADGHLPGSYEVSCRNLTCIIRFRGKAGLVYAHGTLGQVYRNHGNSSEIFYDRLNIVDYPSFPHRGLLIDTGKRYLSLQSIKQTVKLMASVKMNILHWHLTDDVSFSADIERFPRLQKGNPSPFAYSAEDIAEVIQFAQQFAVHVIPDIDVPGRTQSWIRGYPFLKGQAAYYMDPISHTTEDMVIGVLMRLADMFSVAGPDKNVLHLGGSSVGKAWDTKALEDWTRKHGKFHNKTDLVNEWLRSVVAEVKRHTRNTGLEALKLKGVCADLREWPAILIPSFCKIVSVDAEVIMWDDFLLEGATAVDRVDTWQILNHNVEETLKLATTGRFKSLIYSTDFVISDLGTGYGNDWVKFYYVRLLNDKKGVIKGGEAKIAVVDLRRKKFIKDSIFYVSLSWLAFWHVCSQDSSGRCHDVMSTNHVEGRGKGAAAPPEPPLMIWPVPKSIMVNSAEGLSKSEDNYDSHFVFELQANGGPVQQGDLDFVLGTFAFRKFTATPSRPVAVSVEYDVGLLDEAYEFTCTPQLCHLKFSSRSGFFYGTVTA
ncbi:hypothetical protein FOZ62_029425, partial [Perkinsus olseni]